RRPRSHDRGLLPRPTRAPNRNLRKSHRSIPKNIPNPSKSPQHRQSRRQRRQTQRHQGQPGIKGSELCLPCQTRKYPAPCHLFFYSINQIFAFKWVLESIYFWIVLTTVIVLKNIDISIPEWKFTAIVGPSGSRKSTILQLLERFYDPVEGEITLDRHDIRSLNVKFLRSRMGLVSQEPVLFGTSVFENVCHGY